MSSGGASGEQIALLHMLFSLHERRTFSVSTRFPHDFKYMIEWVWVADDNNVFMILSIFSAETETSQKFLLLLLVYPHSHLLLLLTVI